MVSAVGPLPRKKIYKKAKKAKFNVAKVFNDFMLKEVQSAIDKGTPIPWHMPWSAKNQMPMAVKTRNTTRSYSGFNVFWLSMIGAMLGFSDPRYITKTVLKELGGRIKQEELGRSFPVAFYKTGPVIQDKSKTYTEEELDELPRYRILRYYRVYNVEQCENLVLPELETESPRNDMTPIQQAEDIYRKMNNKPTLKHGGNRAFYVSKTDTITLPKQESFDSIEEYYSTKFHELGHSTGHTSRVGREGIAKFDHFGSERYALEELVAELTSANLCNTAGITITIENSKAYLVNWLEKLKEDETLLVKAGTQAMKAYNYITGGE